MNIPLCETAIIFGQRRQDTIVSGIVPWLCFRPRASPRTLFGQPQGDIFLTLSFAIMNKSEGVRSSVTCRIFEMDGAKLTLWSCIVAVASSFVSNSNSKILHTKMSALRIGEQLDRRRWLQLVVSLASPANAIVGGSEVSRTEAAEAGAVALWIDLEGCDICRHDVPAACSGTLISRDLVLSAQHCIDIPESLNGKLSRVVFGTDMFDRNAATVEVEKYLRPLDVGLNGEDLVLIKLKQFAPDNWRIARLPTSPREEYPRLELYGYGDAVDSPDDYTSGTLHKLQLAAVTPAGPANPAFFTFTLDRRAGSCSGDSGGPALSTKGKTLVGVLSSNSTPCAGNNAKFVNPIYFREFLSRASRQLGSKIDGIS